MRHFLGRYSRVVSAGKFSDAAFLTCGKGLLRSLKHGCSVGGMNCSTVRQIIRLMKCFGGNSEMGTLDGDGEPSSGDGCRHRVGNLWLALMPELILKY
ncbi:hypothetical protein CEXT_212501 [Caerostris extrusa]|uniref:Uncharacterized protein n=1 Tax=Caerostris extrusa TaxID=172846 RepID=A0AAV4R6J2_CAEEX|nr:hypothetical protein CEXT_212501 [Caerostris extrusa]